MEKEVEMSGLLFDFAELDQPNRHKVKRGDIYRLGRHLLMCGDSTSQLDVESLMSADKADLVFTDPPYGMGKENEGVLNDNKSADDLVEFNKRWIGLSLSFLKDNGSWYCWGTDESCMDIYACILRPLIRQGKITFRNMITWWKGEGGLGVGGQNLRCYPSHSEKCLFVMKGNKGFISLKEYKIPFCAELNERLKLAGFTPMAAAEMVCSQNRQCNENNYESRVHAFKQHIVAYSMFNKPKPEYWQLWFGSMDGYDDFSSRYEAAKADYRKGFNYFDGKSDKCNDVWNIASVSSSEKKDGGNHPTVKPQRLVARGILTSSPKNGIVLDLFGGSGSTLIACESLGRECRVMELDEQWCEVIIDRWVRKTGGRPQLVSRRG